MENDKSKSQDQKRASGADATSAASAAAPSARAAVAEFKVGGTKVRVERDAKTMGAKTAALVASAMSEAARAGKKPALWLMAAPSGFAFYDAFVEMCERDAGLAAICKDTLFFQFDDYPVPRGDARFPITFRHLLETRFFAPLVKVCGPLPGVRLLEIGTKDDARVCAEYAEKLLRAAADPAITLIQLKGIGMDGHWGFHGSETPLDTAPGIVRVEMNSANVHQQRLDWPEYFKRDEDVPRYACTCDVALFLKADLIVDNVPQSTKAYSVLATYGNELVIPEVPSTALKTHKNSYAFLTEDSASALLEYRSLRESKPEAKLPAPLLKRLEALWDSGDPRSRDANSEEMRHVLKKLGMI
jgi:6-phosphogluconolactonase/glucosamine-6-phosphate isomerase/deaminase